MKTSRRANNRGISVIGVVVALGLVATLFLGVTELIQMTSRLQRSLEFKNDLILIKTRLMTEIDCQKTMAASGITDVATQCTPTNIFYLRNRNDAVIGGAVGTGVLANSRQMEGGWYYRVTCDATNQTLVVQLARQGPTPTSFGEDPQNKTLYDWTYARGTLFGANGKICGQEFGPGGGGGGNLNFAVAPLASTGQGCYLSISRDDDGNPQVDGTIYAATALCPAGQSVNSGGVNCTVAGASPARGFVVSSGPEITGAGWSGSCCIYNGNFDAANHRAFANCQ